MSNRASMVPSTTTNIQINSLPPSATKSNSFNHLESGSLFSVRQTCDHNCTAVLTKISKIFKSIEVSSNALCPTIIQGHHNAPSQTLYSVSLTNHPP